VTRVLVVDDEPQILRALAINLRARGYEVSTAVSGGDALSSAARHPPDLVVLDLGLPDMDGVEVVRGLRGWLPAPILILSGRTESADKVEALDAGADDYVTKPFSVDELFARLRAVARRAQPTDTLPTVTFGDVIVDLATRRVTRRPISDRDAPDNPRREDYGSPGPDGALDEEVHLTPTEWHLLDELLRHPGKLLSRRNLLAQTWGPGYETANGNLRVFMAQLRRKLESDPARPRYLLTEPGLGYRFEPAGRATNRADARLR
jgi:two-component system, OmpR family, KDP operon response regulator KdpE